MHTYMHTYIHTSRRLCEDSIHRIEMHWDKVIMQYLQSEFLWDLTTVFPVQLSIRLLEGRNVRLDDMLFLRVGKYLCVCVCMYVCMYIYIYIYIYVCMYMYYMYI
jgi:hypothetical protein